MKFKYPVKLALIAFLMIGTVGVVQVTVPAAAHCAEMTSNLAAGTVIYRKVKGKTIKKELEHSVAVTVIREKKTLALVMLPDGEKWWVKKSHLISKVASKTDAPNTAVEQSEGTPEKKPVQQSNPTPGKASKTKETVIALDLTSEFLDEDELKHLNAAVQDVLRKHWGSALIGQDEVANWMNISEDSKRLNCIQNQKCMMELSRKVSSNLIFGGVVGKIGSQFIINLYLMDGTKGTAVARQSREAQNEDGLEAAAAEAASALLREMQGIEKAISIDMSKLGSHPKIAIMDFQASGVDVNLSRNISDVVAAELKQFKQLQIIARQEIAALLQFEETRQGMGCEDESCFVEIGNALGVGYLVVGNIGLVEDTYILGIKVINMRKVSIVGREQEQFKGPAEGLLPAARFTVRRLFGVPYDGEGLLKLSVSEEEAKVSLGEEELGLYPSLKVPDTLIAGKYRITVEKEDYYPISRDIYIEPARQTQAQFVMEELPDKWYETWWFWTIVGTVVAGGATTAAVLLTMDGNTPDTGNGSFTVQGGGK